MPFYDYYCEANDRTVEVFHGIKERFTTWKEVCACAKIEQGDTPEDAAVVRMISGNPTVWKLKGIDKDMPSTKLEL